MIAHLTGTVARTGDGHVVLDVNHVGYLVHVPAQPEYQTLTGSATLFTHLAVRENALDLYGFLTSAELALFAELLNVPKIGPKSALQILSQATPRLISEATVLSDAQYLRKTSRLGQKTCEAIITHLNSREFFRDTLAFAEGSAIVHHDAIEALIGLGYEPAAVHAFVRQQPPDTPTSAIITLGLRTL